MIFILLAIMGCNKNTPELLTVQVYGISSKKAVIKWTGVFPNENDLLYQVVLNDSILTQPSTRFFYEIKGLEEKTTYSGHVVASDMAANKLHAEPFSFETQENKAPQDYVVDLVDITGESASINWEEPFDPDGDDIRYELVLNNVTVDDSVMETNYTFNGLASTTHYSVIVVAKDGHGNHVPRSISFKTMDPGSKLAYVNENYAGQKREYGIYLPSSTGSEKLPLVISLHGWGGVVWPGMTTNYFVTLAEDEQFISLMPQAQADKDGNIAWQYPDDLEFIKRLIDTLTVRHKVDMERIYLTGHSNGAFMTYKLGKALEYKLAAIGPIAGTLSFPDYYNYSLLKPMPLCHIHGTADSTVQVQGNPTHASFEKILEFFIPNNNCNPIPTVIELPDINKHDNSTVTKITYSTQSISSGDIVYYRINNGNHSVPGTNSWANKDIHAYDVLWEFFKSRKLSDK